MQNVYLKLIQVKKVYETGVTFKVIWTSKRVVQTPSYKDCVGQFPILHCLEDQCWVVVRSKLESGDLSLNLYLAKQLSGDCRPVLRLSQTHPTGIVSAQWRRGEPYTLSWTPWKKGGINKEMKIFRNWNYEGWLVSFSFDILSFLFSEIVLVFLNCFCIYDNILYKCLWAAWNPCWRRKIVE